jgi:uridine kinase
MNQLSALLVIIFVYLAMLTRGAIITAPLRKNVVRSVASTMKRLATSRYPVVDQTNVLELEKEGSLTKYSRSTAPAPVILGIAGGSASGKTTLAKAIIKELGAEHVSFIGHDSYYKELAHLSIEERANVNFDHPSSLDTKLLVHHLQKLKDGEAVDVPIYSFATHTRTAHTELVTPRSIVIVDGILIFAEPELLSLMDMKVFVDTDDDLRLIRRIKRDISERNRTVDAVMTQYMRTVRPMHLLYVEPSKRFADIIVPAGQGIQPVALDMCVSRLREIINRHTVL